MSGVRHKLFELSIVCITVAAAILSYVWFETTGSVSFFSATDLYLNLQPCSFTILFLFMVHIYIVLVIIRLSVVIWSGIIKNILSSFMMQCDTMRAFELFARSDWSGLLALSADSIDPFLPSIICLLRKSANFLKGRYWMLILNQCSVRRNKIIGQAYKIHTG